MDCSIQIINKEEKKDNGEVVKTYGIKTPSCCNLIIGFFAVIIVLSTISRFF